MSTLVGAALTLVSGWEIFDTGNKFSSNISKGVHAHSSRLQRVTQVGINVIEQVGKLAFCLGLLLCGSHLCSADPKLSLAVTLPNALANTSIYFLASAGILVGVALIRAMR